MPVTYVITFRVVPDRREEFLERLQYVLAEMKSEPTYYEAILHRDPQFENIFMLYETWESHDDVVNEQLNRPYRRAWHDALAPLVTGLRAITNEQAEAAASLNTFETDYRRNGQRQWQAFLEAFPQGERLAAGRPRYAAYLPGH